MTESHNSDPNQEIIDQMYTQYCADPMSVPQDWQEYFAAVEAQRKAHEVDAVRAARRAENATAHLEPGAGPGPVDEASPSKSVSFDRVAADVTRSDLPPLPNVNVAEPTSPYVMRETALAKGPKHEQKTDDSVERLKGAGRAVAKNMEASLGVPTATSAREIPAKLLIENRQLINDHLKHTRGGKISFTHLIAYALVEALVENPAMNVRYEEIDGKPAIREFAHVGLGLAIDLPQKDGSRQLMVPVIHQADLMNFSQFIEAYEELVKRARSGKLGPKDFQGASATLTNPGMIGTKHSVPRLMVGQGCIIGVGATSYPAQWAGASPKTLARNGVGPIMTMTSTYDHRVIQGAGSGVFLQAIDKKLAGQDGFYERVFTTLRIPHEPFGWERDYDYDEDTEKGKPARIAEIIHAYRSRGHLAADSDPLQYRVRQHPDLSISNYGLSVWDLDRVFPTGGFSGTQQMSLRDLLGQLRNIYTRTAGIEYMHIQDPVQRQWIQKKIERPWHKATHDEQRRILKALNRAEAFEMFLQTKYVGQKRFSLEGGESLIPLMERILYTAVHQSVREVTIGMAHRGRLNILANIAGKTYGQIFSEFEGNYDPGSVQGTGDVKYHLGTEGVFSPEDGLALKVSLAANPSHLEAADTVTEGLARAKQDMIADNPEDAVVPILIHGDAAFIGQGVVQETLNMSQLKGFRTGGTIHIIVNNQIGFTTPPQSGRSTRYCTDLAKGLQVPIIHVNGNDPEMVVWAGKLALEFRQAFNKDVIIDLVCYRRRGHNEGDDPSMTQPIMYSLIDQLPTPRAFYARDLIGRGDLTEDEAEELLNEYHDELNKILAQTRERGWSPDAQDTKEINPGMETRWVRPQSQMPGEGMMIGWKSAVAPEFLERIGDAHVRIPEGFTAHPKMKQLLERRRKMAYEGKIDWGFGELLAFGTLLTEGTPIRMSGQDCRRGTFVQRHAVFHDHETGEEWTPLQFLTDDQARFQIYDSPLSEYGPLAFEYGYSLERPESLVVWEAQFGDFANGCQTVIDEFISSAEQKWSERCSLVMLLPHGYEGQGPDHSSARIERYLQLCAQDNMRVCQPSTPANHFHLLRSQAYLRPRKPLIVFTPKQLLRLSAATSPREDFTSGEFKTVIGEVNQQVLDNASSVERVLLCTGRLYYDLVKHRNTQEDWKTAIIRLEQLYPLDSESVACAVEPFLQANFTWVQDEPANQGAWPYLAVNLDREVIGQKELKLVSRPESAAPSAGTMKLHMKQHAELMSAAFA
ncbi:MAG: multifunctional oxoglutarate decarboxylase/oxoglutarate dehydrogenase thiamine pyrophosphate-binding subunit/dihydrolipoyllysine-residue succinyltransferase subunit [Actinomycetaceae bacterium]|nr:multifunctional oxoglutarate decarboxylase/oxoglutarate dehydrogenase thiamine pyrophosphate-binding subunit/dihydrolipoyllysine-residue succinyltransferase subunit [Actinomycetaceae bacterium]